MSSLNRASTFIKMPEKKRKKDGANWTLSYGDMVTALLCFFIIFYAIEKQFEKQRANPVKGYAEAEGILTEHKVGHTDTGFDYTIESFHKITGIETQRSSNFVDIFFKKTVFFNRGEIELTREGQEALDEVVKRLVKLDGKYMLEIQGHADSIPVKQMKNRWWKNNMELSVLRALKVHSYLSDQKIQKENLVVSGYGSQKKISDSPSDKEEINRRISLRLQLVK